MDDDKLIEIAATLEAHAVDSKLQLKRGKPEPLVALTANRAGFLRLAARCLRAAAEPIPEDDCRSKFAKDPLPNNHEDVVDDDSDLIICALQRMETWPEPNEYIEAGKKRAAKNDGPALLACGLICTVILFVIVAGITSIVGWFQ